MGVTIREQDAKYMFRNSQQATNAGAGGVGGGFGTLPGLAGGAGAENVTNPANDAEAAARAAGAPGTAGGGRTNRTAEAVAGESVAEFAARNGLSPAAWRAFFCCRPSSGAAAPTSGARRSPFR